VIDLRPNVLLLVLDSVRAKNTSLHGHLNDTTPFLTRFADESTVYEQARAPGVRSLPSHVSIFTGLQVAEHGVTSRDYRLKSGNTIWEQLKTDFDYETGLFSSNLYLTGLDLGLSEGFDTVVGSADVPFPKAINPGSFVRNRDNYTYLDFIKSCLTHDQPLRSITNGALVKTSQQNQRLTRSVFNRHSSADRYSNRFLDWIQDRDGPWAACINFMDTHYPFVPTRRRLQWSTEEMLKLQDKMSDPPVWSFYGNESPWWQWVALEGLYDETIRYVDSQIQSLIQSLKNRGEYENTLIVITSDHGEGFGEQSYIRPGVRIAGHGGHAGLHESVLHVPLVVKFPNQKNRRRIEQLASLTNFPSIVNQAIHKHETDFNAFVPESPVVASTSGMYGEAREQMKKYSLNSELYTNPMRAVYKQEGDRIRKFMTWSGEAATVEIRGIVNHKLCSQGITKVNDAFEGIDDHDVRESTTDTVADDQVEDRLRELGYL